MEDRLTMIRRQMEQTKGRFEQKLATLEELVAKQVQSAGTAVSAPAEAVQDVVHSVGNAFDVERQFRRHPWLFVGGAVAMGYIVTQLLKSNGSSPNSSSTESHNNVNGVGSADSGPTGSGQLSITSPPRTTTIAGDSQAPSAIAAEIRRAATGAFTGIAQELVARSVPHLMQYFRGDTVQESSTQERRSESVQPDRV